jgi:hypothetical protein
MSRLLDRWRATAFHQYFEALEPIDRQTFWVAVALALALGISITAISRSRDAQPPRSSVPFDARFASSASSART